MASDVFPGNCDRPFNRSSVVRGLVGDAQDRTPAAALRGCLWLGARKSLTGKFSKWGFDVAGS